MKGRRRETFFAELCLGNDWTMVFSEFVGSVGINTYFKMGIWADFQSGLCVVQCGPIRGVVIV
jgi:hypothetical protein